MAQIRRSVVAIATVFLAVGMLISMGVSAGAAEPTADDIEEAIDDVESYEYETEFSSSSTSVVDGEEQESHSEGEGSGAVNVTAGEMKEEMITETTGDEVLEEGPFETQMYLVDETYYTGTTAPGEETEWIQMDAPETGGITEGPLTQYKTLLSASDVTTVGKEEVDGTETYVLELDVDMEAYTEEMIAELGTGDINEANGDLNEAARDNAADGAVDGDVPEAIAEPDQDMTVTIWVDCETDLPVKAELTSETVMEGLGAYEEDNVSEDMSEIESIEMTVTQTTYFEAYNEPVTIDLPEDAEDAQTLEELLEDFDAEFDVDEDEFAEDGEAVDEDELDENEELYEAETDDC